jgi:hypothetical protein
LNITAIKDIYLYLRIRNSITCTLHIVCFGYKYTRTILCIRKRNGHSEIIAIMFELYILVFNSFKGIVQPFELKCVTRLIRSAVKNWRSGNFFKSFLMTQSHERSIKPYTAA